MKLTSILFKQIITLEPKFCVSCLHFIPNKFGNEYVKCNLFPVEIEDTYLITGNRKDDFIEYIHCSTARKFNRMCGENANKYEAIKN